MGHQNAFLWVKAMATFLAYRTVSVKRFYVHLVQIKKRRLVLPSNFGNSKAILTVLA